MSCGNPGCTPPSPCKDCKAAIVEQYLATKEGTRALYQEARLPVPEVIADTLLGRIQQFYVAIGYEPKEASDVDASA